MTDTEVRKQALEPLTATLLARARADADGERAAARQEGERVVEAARDQADAVLAQARALGEADAAAILAAERDHPAGGVVAVSPDGRRIDASLDALVDAALAELDLEQLWAAP